MTEDRKGSVPARPEYAYIPVRIAGTEPPIVIPASPEVLGELSEWSEPVRVRARQQGDHWELIFSRVVPQA